MKTLFRTSPKFILIISLFLSGCAQAGTGSPAATLAPQPSSQVTKPAVRVLELPTQQPAPILSATPTLDVPPTLAAQPTLGVQSTAVLAATSPAVNVTPVAIACTNLAELVQHISVPPNTYLEAGTGFGKVWRIKNVGTCTWTKDYSLVFIGGDKMNSPDSMPLPNAVEPNVSIDLKLILYAPYGDPKLYSGKWMLQDASGNQFGVGDQSTQPITTTLSTSPNVGYGIYCR